MTTHPARHDLVEALRAIGCTYSEDEDRWYHPRHRHQWAGEDPATYLGWIKGYDDCVQHRAALASEAASQVPADGVVYVDVSALTGTGKSAICGEIEIAMKAIGVPVEWSNGDSEKRMTHADWQEALELYRPRVVITERNIPRAAAPDQEGPADGK